MRLFRAFFPLILTVLIVVALDRPWLGGKLPALGRLLDPVNGWAANAEPVDKDYSGEFKIAGLQKPVAIAMEDRLVPHICAENDHDLYFAQGYVHAYFRLWQMDLQTRAAAGRVGKVIVKKGVAKFDDMQRRKGMVYGAENSLKVMEADPRTKQMLDAYRDGINAYITSLNYAQLPLEYKLMGFKPEPWTNIKSALLLKYMADDLTGYTEDFPLTYLRDVLSREDLDLLYPEKVPGSKPVIPEGTKFEAPSLKEPAAPGDSVFVHFSNRAGNSQSAIGNVLQGTFANCQSPTADYEKDGIGSNNWAISGKHTASGAAILCNDPHLGLNLPSLWFEVQLTAPGINAYGVSLPGAPGIVIGFNDSISWGFTNNYRDVKDFYQITPVDADHYLFNGKSTAYIKRPESITVKDSTSFVDTVLYTIHGPVMYDANHIDPAKTGRQYALRWMAHEATNELLALYNMNRAKTYDEWVKAIMHFECPAQNMVYADREGNIAMWGQGQFINKWKGQGKYVMEGKDSLTLWGEKIPMMENPHALNPEQGYLVSANQTVTDSTYPYWYNGHFLEFRAWEINKILGYNTSDFIGKLNARDSGMGETRFIARFNVNRLGYLQNNCTSYLANKTIGLLAYQLPTSPYADIIMDKGKGSGWHSTIGAYQLFDTSVAGTLFQTWWYFLIKDIWQDDFPDVPSDLLPCDEVTMQLLLSDSTSKYYDDKTTTQIETLKDIVAKSFKETTDSLDVLKKKLGSLEWYKVKNTTLAHLTKLPAFSYDHLKIGGWGNTINAVKNNHGPSWRMIVEMGKDSIRALGVYPGGQSGNPGSKYYGTFINNWVEGKYYSLLFESKEKLEKDDRIKYRWTIEP
jgi:penicillin amidase